MPIYEFDCQECGEPFEELVRSAGAVDEVSCPICGSERVRKKLSRLATRVGGGGTLVSVAGGDCAPGGL